MEPEKKSNGALIGLAIIVIILIIGGIYMWQTQGQGSKQDLNQDTEQTQSGAAVTTQDSTDLNNLDKDLESVDTNIDASVINSVQ